MAKVDDWTIPEDQQPRGGDLAYDLDAALASMVTLTAKIPEDAFTADVLGTERAGYGVVIQDGVVLTVGYLITEAQEVWLGLSDGRAVAGTPIAFDFETGFGLVQILGRTDVAPLPIGVSGTAALGTRVVVAGAGGRTRSVAARVIARQTFAGYWEYLLEDALFTTPGHPHWGGTAMIGPDGTLLGIGSLQLAAQRPGSDDPEAINMMIPIDLLPPILDDLLRYGATRRPPRPWLGLYATETEDHLTIIGVANQGPAARAGIKPGDIVTEVAGTAVTELDELWRAVRARGSAGVTVPLTVMRDERQLTIPILSSDRARFLKAPRLH